jgi:hypothetical protein
MTYGSDGKAEVAKSPRLYSITPVLIGDLCDAFKLIYADWCHIFQVLR